MLFQVPANNSTLEHCPIEATTNATRLAAINARSQSLGCRLLLLDPHNVPYNVTELLRRQKEPTMKRVILEIFTDYI